MSPSLSLGVGLSGSGSVGATDPSAGVWPLVIAIAVGIFAIRLSFIQLRSVVDGFPAAIERALGLVPAAILAALVAPELVAVDGPITGVESLVAAVTTVRTAAGVVAAVVAWRTGSMLATVVAGMATLWGLQFLVG